MRWVRLVAAAGLGALLVGCGSNSSGNSSPGGTGSSLSGSITVLAAASLTESFNALGKQFEAAHPGTTVKFSFGASSALAQQVTSGVPADVFASASTGNMDTVVRGGDAADPANFARNVAEIAVPADNPAKIATLADLTRSGVKVALCEPQVPCGKLAAAVFRNANLTVKPVTLGPDVKAVLTDVRNGEVDAGVVYVTDVNTAGDKVKGIEIPAAQNASTEYPIAVLKASRNSALAQAFVDYVKGAEGRAELSKVGFAAP